MLRALNLHRLVLLVVCLFALPSCADLSPLQQRVLSGGSIGSTAGIVGTVLTGGCIPCGASVGSVVGSIAGYGYDRYEEDKPFIPTLD